MQALNRCSFDAIDGLIIQCNNTYGILCRISTIESSQKVITILDQRVADAVVRERERGTIPEGNDSYGMYIIPECMYTLTQ